jgi:hypothetical protein
MQSQSSRSAIPLICGIMELNKRLCYYIGNLLAMYYIITQNKYIKNITLSRNHRLLEFYTFLSFGFRKIGERRSYI